MLVERKIVQDFPGLRERIKAARIADGRPVRVLAAEAGISDQLWFKVESGSLLHVPEATLRKMEGALGASFGVEF